MRIHWIRQCVFVLATSALAIGCGDAKQGLMESSALQAEAAADEQIAAENANLAERSAMMESDLRQRQQFYQAVSGTYEGTLSEYQVRIVLSPSLPPYRSERVRTLEEVTSDLNELFLNVQVVQWNDAGTVVSGCVFEGVRPDLSNGRMSLVSDACVNSYEVWLASDTRIGTQPGALVAAESSAQLAASALRGDLSSVTVLRGRRLSTSKVSALDLDVTRVEAPSALPDSASGTMTEDEVRRIQGLEAELSLRQNLFQRFAGIYEATRRNSLAHDASVTFTLMTSVSPYQGSRLRSAEEVLADLERLSYSVQVLEADLLGATVTSCVFEGITPNLKTWELNLAGADCPIVFNLTLAEESGTQLLVGRRSSGVDGLIESFVAPRADAAKTAPVSRVAPIDEPTARRVSELEGDLAKRFRLIMALNGTYEGQVQTIFGAYGVRIQFVPSVTPYDPGRVRSIDEVQADIAALSWTVQIVQWSPADLEAAEGCRVEGVRPDFVGGRVNIASSDCANLYLLSLAGDSKRSASEILDGRMAQADQLAGSMQSSRYPAPFQLSLKRVAQ